jgi:hypothetical protein
VSRSVPNLVGRHRGPPSHTLTHRPKQKKKKDAKIIAELTKERPYLQFLSEKAVAVLDDTFLGLKEQFTAPDPAQFRRAVKEDGQSKQRESVYMGVMCVCCWLALVCGDDGSG